MSRNTKKVINSNSRKTVNREIRFCQVEKGLLKKLSLRLNDWQNRTFLAACFLSAKPITIEFIALRIIRFDKSQILMWFSLMFGFFLLPALVYFLPKSYIKPKAFFTHSKLITTTGWKFVASARIGKTLKSFSFIIAVSGGGRKSYKCDVYCFLVKYVYLYYSQCFFSVLPFLLENCKIFSFHWFRLKFSS